MSVIHDPRLAARVRREPTDDLAAARGIAIALLLSLPFWIGLIVWLRG